jgi:hypothetical protein
MPKKKAGRKRARRWPARGGAKESSLWYVGFSIWQLQTLGTRHSSEFDYLSVCDNVAGEKALEGKIKGLPLAIVADAAAVAE